MLRCVGSGSGRCTKVPALGDALFSRPSRTLGVALRLPVVQAVADLLWRCLRSEDPQRTMAHWSEFDEGGHFPAMEVPDLLVGDMRKFFRSLW
jgi:hypothetical protein